MWTDPFQKSSTSFTLIFSKILPKICMVPVMPQFLSPVSMVSARKAWDHEPLLARTHKRNKVNNDFREWTSTRWFFVYVVKLEFGNVGFWGGGKPEYLKKNLSEQGREPTTNLTHIWHQWWVLNQGHIGGRQVISPALTTLLPSSLALFL